MKKIKPLLSALGFSSLLITSVFASDLSPKLTVAIIKDIAGSSDIKNGDYHTGIKSLSRSSSVSKFDKSMGLCVAYLQANSFTNAEVACTDAITAIETHQSTGHKAKELKALAYNNRGIVKYFQDDAYGALVDLSTAVKLSDDPLIVSNINYLKMSAGTSLDETAFLLAAE